MAKSEAKLKPGFRRRPDGQIEYRFWMPHPSKPGEKYRASVYGRTQAECLTKADEKRDARVKGTLVVGQQARDSVGELLQRWLGIIKPEEVRDANGRLTGHRGTISAKTYRAYEAVVVRDVIPAIGKVSLKAISGAEVQALYNRYADRPRLAYYIHQTLNRCFNQCRKLRLISVPNPCEGTEPIRPDKHEITPPTADEAARFFAYLASKANARHITGGQNLTQEGRWYPLFLMMARTGMRPSEAIGLEWSDVDLSKYLVQVRRSRSTEGEPVVQKLKTAGSARTVAIDIDLVAVLYALKRRQEAVKKDAGDLWEDNNLVFCNMDRKRLYNGRPALGRPIYWANAADAFRALLGKAGLPTHFRPYDLRHHHVTTLLEQDVPDTLVAKRVGHVGTAMIGRTYGHLHAKKDEELAQRYAVAMGISIPEAPVDEQPEGTYRIEMTEAMRLALRQRSVVEAGRPRSWSRIAAAMGVSPAYPWQLHQKALGVLRVLASDIDGLEGQAAADWQEFGHLVAERAA